MENIKLVKSKGRYAVITGVETRSFIHPINGYIKKLVISVVDGNGRKFQCSEIWNKQMKVRSLFVYGNSIQAIDNLGQFMEYMNVKSTEELIDKIVFIYPDKDNFLLPACFDHKFRFSESTNTSSKTLFNQNKN